MKQYIFIILFLLFSGCITAPESELEMSWGYPVENGNDIMTDEENYSTCTRCNEKYDIENVYDNEIKHCLNCGEPLYKRVSNDEEENDDE